MKALMTEKQEALQCCVVPRSLSFPYGNNTENVIAGKFDRNPEVKSRELNPSSWRFQAAHLMTLFGKNVGEMQGERARS